MTVVSEHAPCQSDFRDVSNVSFPRRAGGRAAAAGLAAVDPRTIPEVVEVEEVGIAVLEHVGLAGDQLLAVLVQR